MKPRPFLLFVHRWFGLLGGLWLFVLGLTGSILVFHQEMDEVLNPELWHVEARGESRSVSSLVATAEVRHPGSQLLFLELPNDAAHSLLVYLAARPGSGAAVPEGLQVFVDPYTGRILGNRVYGALRLDQQHLVPLLYQLHVDLLLGRSMQWFLGLVALVWIFDHFVAAVLSFPAPRKWMQSFRIGKGARSYSFLYGFHRAGGLWFFPVTLVLGITGLYFNWYETVLAVVSRVSQPTGYYFEVAPELEAPVESPAVSLDQAIAIARSRASGAMVDAISPVPAKGLYCMHVFDAKDLDVNGRRGICVDMRSGAILSDRHDSEGSAGDAFVAWQFPLHSGQAFGWPGRIAVFLGGLALCGLVVTGVLLFLKKQQARRRQRTLLTHEARHSTAPSAARLSC